MAADTAMLIIEDFRLEGLAFRVGAPGTAQGAAFEKDYCPYPRTIVSRKTLNVEDCCHREEHYQVIFICSIFDSVRNIPNAAIATPLEGECLTAPNGILLTYGFVQV
jgi:hypothetical protein